MKQILRINTDRKSVKSVKSVAKKICENQYNPCNPWRKKIRENQWHLCNLWRKKIVKIFIIRGIRVLIQSNRFPFSK